MRADAPHTGVSARMACCMESSSRAASLSNVLGRRRPMLVTVRRDVGSVTMLLAVTAPSGLACRRPLRSGRRGAVRQGAWRSRSGGIGARGFRITAPLLSLAATVLPLMASSRVASEFLKTRVAHGYCSRQLAAGACPYANICETCDNFVPGPEHLPVLRDRLSDIRQLRGDAEQRGWDGEVKRHGRVISALESHCSRLENAPVIPDPP
jgi:hypothetical protein